MRAKFPHILVSLALAAAAAAQPTALTYQGRLKDDGQPASGLHDFRFRLFDAAQGGNQLGDLQCVNNVTVADGLFTAVIDFGQQFASPNQRFLEVQVRKDMGLDCGNGNGFITLAPRQPLTAAPLASHAKSAFALDAADGSPQNAVFVDASGNVGIGTQAPTARLEVAGPVVTGSQGDQADLLWLNSERSWVFRQEGVGAGAALKLQSIGGGGNKNFAIQTDGSVGIGTTAPLAKLDVRGDIRFGPGGSGVQAVGAAETLRIIRGNIDGTGAILEGTGFTCTRIGEGWYEITFTPAFSGVASVTATASSTIGGSKRFAENCMECINQHARTIVRISSDKGDYLNSKFSFIAVGPR